MTKEQIKLNAEVEVQARAETIPGPYTGMRGKVSFIDPVGAVSLSVIVRLEGNIPIQIAPEQLRLIHNV